MVESNNAGTKRPVISSSSRQDVASAVRDVISSAPQGQTVSSYQATINQVPWDAWEGIFRRFSSATLHPKQRDVVKLFSTACFDLKDSEKPLRFPGVRGEGKSPEEDAKSRAAVGAIFFQRSFRKEALVNCDDVLKSTSYVKTQLLNSAQAESLENELQFALFEYLAQFQAVKDHIGVIRSQETELVRSFINIERCAKLMKHVALRKARLALEQVTYDIKQRRAIEPDAPIDDLQDKFRAAEVTYKICCDTLHDPIPFVENLNPNKYDLCQRPLAAKMQKGKVYYRNLDGKVAYSVITPFGLEVYDEVTEIPYPEDTESLTPRQLHDLKERILKVSAERGHTLKRHAVKTLLPAFLVKLLGIDRAEDQQDSDFVISRLSAGNGIRLFWVWTRCMIESMVPTAHNNLIVSTTVAGYVSFILYWVRGLIVFLGGLIHSFDFPWVNEEERVIPAWERLKAHWKDRRDEILNDLVWGTGNYACFDWFVGSLFLGFLADLITGTLLTMDLFLARCRYRDGLADHNDKIDAYDSQLEELIECMLEKAEAIHDGELKKDLTKLLKSLRGVETIEHAKAPQGLIESKQEMLAQVRKINTHFLTLSSAQRDAYGHEKIEALEVLFRQFNVFNTHKENRHSNWEFDYTTLVCDVFYAIALFIAFSTMVGFYLHLLHLSLPIAIPILGASMLCVSTIVWRTARAFFDRDGIVQTNKAANDNELAYHQLMENFVALGHKYQDLLDTDIQALAPEVSLRLEHDKDRIDNQMKQLYLDMLRTATASGQQNESSWFKWSLFYRATALRVLAPIAIALTLAFAPAMVASAPTYVFVLLGVLLAAVVSSYAVHWWFQPKPSAKWQRADKEENKNPYFTLPEKNEYEAFKQLVLSPENKTVDETAALLPEKTKGTNVLQEIKRHRTAGNLGLFRGMRDIKFKYNEEAEKFFEPDSPPTLAIPAA